eukprot:TCONS_00040652-protein
MRIHSLHSLHVLTKLSVSVPRVPCDESTHPVTTSEVKRPSVKRHKLGTTTISNLASKTSEELGIFTKNQSFICILKLQSRILLTKYKIYHTFLHQQSILEELVKNLIFFIYIGKYYFIYLFRFKKPPANGPFFFAIHAISVHANFSNSRIHTSEKAHSRK